MLSPPRPELSPADVVGRGLRQQPAHPNTYVRRPVASAGAPPTRSFFCALGCLVRGLAPDVRGLYLGNLVLGLGAANLWTSVLSYVSLQTSREQRSMMVSAFLVQVSVLRMVGRALYPACNQALLLFIEDELVRDRIVMSVCTVFCMFGVVALLLDPHRQDTTALAAELEEQHQAVAMETGDADALPICEEDAGSAEEGTAAHGQRAGRETPVAAVKPSVGGFVLVIVVLVVQSAATTMTKVLWPLYLHDRYRWGAPQYAYVLLIAEVSSTATMSLFPAFEHRFGRFRTAASGCVFAGVLALLAFQFGKPSGLEMTAHVALTAGLLSIGAGLEPSLKSLASLHMPQSLQGISFGWMSVSSGVGAMIGSMSGAYLYSISKALTPSSVTGNGALPLVAVGAVLLLAGGVLHVAARIRPRSEDDCLDGITAAVTAVASGVPADQDEKAQ